MKAADSLASYPTIGNFVCLYILHITIAAENQSRCLVKMNLNIYGSLTIIRAPVHTEHSEYEFLSCVHEEYTMALCPETNLQRFVFLNTVCGMVYMFQTGLFM